MRLQLKKKRHEEQREQTLDVDSVNQSEAAWLPHPKSLQRAREANYCSQGSSFTPQNTQDMLLGSSSPARLELSPVYR